MWCREEFFRSDTPLNETESGQKCHKKRVSDSVLACPNGHFPWNGSFWSNFEADPRNSAFCCEKPIRVRKCPKRPNFSDGRPPPVDGHRRKVHFALCFARIVRSSAEKWHGAAVASANLMGGVEKKGKNDPRKCFGALAVDLRPPVLW
jgi:hypothetical protein